MRDLGWRRGSSKIRRGSKEDGARKVSSMDQGIWEETIRKDANKEGMGLCDRSKEGVCAKKENGLSIIEGGKRGSKRVYLGAAEKRVHLTVEITTDGTSILHGEKGWKKENGLGLSVSE